MFQERLNELVLMIFEIDVPDKVDVKNVCKWFRLKCTYYSQCIVHNLFYLRKKNWSTNWRFNLEFSHKTPKLFAPPLNVYITRKLRNVQLFDGKGRKIKTDGSVLVCKNKQIHTLIPWTQNWTLLNESIS